MLALVWMAFGARLSAAEKAPPVPHAEDQRRRTRVESARSLASHHLFWSASFVLLNLVGIGYVLHDKDHPRHDNQPLPKPPRPPLTRKLEISAQEVIGWEYEYARITASEAMQDRQTMVNFYFLLIGVVASGVVANLDKLGTWIGASTLLLWGGCIVGWFLFLIVVRLREAWHSSAKTMLKLRDFCIQHARDVEPEILIKGFPWRVETLPPAGKRWSVFFYSGLLIAFLNSVSFVVGGLLLAAELRTATPLSVAALLVLGALLLAFHLFVYSALLAERRPQAAAGVTNE